MLKRLFPSRAPAAPHYPPIHPTQVLAIALYSLYPGAAPPTPPAPSQDEPLYAGPYR